MSTILLPASRRETVNLIEYSLAGRIVSGTSASGVGLVSVSSPTIAIANMGLEIGDVISCSAEVKSATPGEATRLNIQAYDASGVFLSNIKSSTPVDAQVFTRHVCENIAIPSGTAFLLPVASRVSGAGSYSMRNAMINRGSTAQPYDIPKRGAWTPIVRGLIARNNEQAVQRFLSGAQQLTSYASRRWLLQFQTPTLEGDELREWELVLGQLSDLSNVFRFVPPRYTGPSTGYEGANPAVNGASQTGTSLVCDGVDASTDIVDKGDWLSYEVTTSGGQTNVQLHQVTALATSDASGNVTISITPAIRLSPADNATVQIFAPTGQFRFAQPSAGIDLQLLRRSAIAVEAEEAIWL